MSPTYQNTDGTPHWVPNEPKSSLAELEQPVVDHRLRSAGGLLGRLEDGERRPTHDSRDAASSVAAPASQVTCMS